MTYTPDNAGTGRLLKSFEGVVNAHAEKVAASARTQEPEADVVVDSYETDRDAAVVVVREPEAITWQVRDGLLTRAAAAAGLQVRG